MPGSRGSISHCYGVLQSQTNFQDNYNLGGKIADNLKQSSVFEQCAWKSQGESKYLWPHPFQWGLPKLRRQKCHEIWKSSLQSHYYGSYYYGKPQQKESVFYLGEMGHPTTLGWIKINIDETLQPANAAGLGAVIRDE